MQGEVRKVLFNLWKPTLRSLFESSESTRRPGERRLKVFMKRNLILNQRCRFISDTKMGLSFSPCCCLFWNEYHRQSLRERPAALCWKVILNPLWSKLNIVFMLTGLSFLVWRKCRSSVVMGFCFKVEMCLIYLRIFWAYNTVRPLVSKHLVNVCWN